MPAKTGQPTITVAVDTAGRVLCSSCGLISSDGGTTFAQGHIALEHYGRAKVVTKNDLRRQLITEALEDLATVKVRENLDANWWCILSGPRLRPIVEAVIGALDLEDALNGRPCGRQGCTNTVPCHRHEGE